jgi:DNA primase
VSGYAPNNDVDRVRDASDIVGVIGDHLALKAKGREYVCLCPFHDDRNPSMCVVPAKQMYHCFVCGAGGDVFRFIMEYHSMTFREALTHLAERANIELTPWKPSGGNVVQGGPQGASKSDIVEVNATAQAFFRAILAHPEHGASARALIDRRGISAEMVEGFGIGASPDRWDGLLTYAQSKGLSIEALRAAGLLKVRDSGGGGGMYDALRNRLIFPIRDQIGRPIAFGARRIDDEDEPKYLNSPETSAFNKSTTLFGIDRAARAIKRERVAVVVEGYTDVIACHQHGVEHVVGTLGTALTTGHAAVLRRLCDTVVLLFDGDEAGQRAADRAIEVLLKETIDIKIASLAGVTDAKDPDELLAREGGVETFNRAIDGAIDLLTWRFDRLRRELSGQGAARVTQRIEEEIRTLVDLGVEQLSPMRRRLIVRQIAHAAGVEEDVVRASMRLGRRGPVRGEDETRGVTREGGGATRFTPREMLLGCLLSDELLWVTMTSDEHDMVRTTAFDSRASALVAQALLESVENGSGTGLRSVLGELNAMEGGSERAEVDASGRAAALCRAIDEQCEGDRERRSRFMRECVRSVALAETDGASRPEVVDDAEALRAFMERERAKRERFGDAPGRLSSGGR